MNFRKEMNVMKQILRHKVPTLKTSRIREVCSVEDLLLGSL